LSEPPGPKSSIAILVDEEAGDARSRARDVWQRLGMSGDAAGTNGISRQVLLYGLAIAAVLVGAVNIINVITIQHEAPRFGLVQPAIWEGTSWITFLLFLWIPWLAWRAAPPNARPHWRLLLHIPAALTFSLCHVGGFLLLRKLIYWLAGSHYGFGEPLAAQFLYELRKDVFGYVLFIGAFTLLAHLLHQQYREPTHETRLFDIRDGTRLIRIPVDDILAVTSAGNYVEFLLRDGRRPLMRSPLSSIEAEFAPRGFIRTHRSWVVNPRAVTGLKPEGSGDYTVEIGELAVPLSRRFPQALERLRG
jgi:LytTr DNA-binding domain-containing protein